ncbi:uncharacterized protein BYT42DRAFT_587160 [Radiomyces spectabilis]|uniref:uncharacterized protein n=1 Tax=Radiomyces spectabilis TaxID=64574 RepID=UPI002220C2BD|nr:uncharacterized protein BYT42DRAFT_587160 [Radiomyces spectabilis]KAI8367701.1 hypothetical protein BYT42DRAFT_587160 [Radiomyces spectabilis]
MVAFESLLCTNEIPSFKRERTDACIVVASFALDSKNLTPEKSNSSLHLIKQRTIFSWIL